MCAWPERIFSRWNRGQRIKTRRAIDFLVAKIGRFFGLFSALGCLSVKKNRSFCAQKSTVTKNRRRSVDKTLGTPRGHQCASNDTRHVDEATQGAPSFNFWLLFGGFSKRCSNGHNFSTAEKIFYHVLWECAHDQGLSSPVGIEAIEVELAEQSIF